MRGSDEVVVLTGEAPFVRILPLNGEPGRAFGSEGEGPGEIESVSGVAVLSSGSIAVADRRGGKLSFFDPEGNWRGSSSHAPLLFALETSPTGAHALALQLVMEEQRNRVLRLDSALDVVDSISVPDTLFRGETSVSAKLWISHAIADDGRIALGAGASAYRILLTDPSGEIRIQLARDLPRPERTRDELAALEARIQADVAAGLPAHVGRGALQKTEAHFGLNDFRFDGHGRLWVRTNRGGLQDTVFDLYGPELEVLGTLQVPHGIYSFHITSDRLVGEITDDTGVPRVMIWRIQESAE